MYDANVQEEKQVMIKAKTQILVAQTIEHKYIASNSKECYEPKITLYQNLSLSQRNDI